MSKNRTVEADGEGQWIITAVLIGVAGKTLNVLVHCRRVDLYRCDVSVETWSVARTGWIGDVTTVLQDGLELRTEYTIEQVTGEVPHQAVELLEPVMVWLAIVGFVEIEATMCNGCDQEAVGSCEGFVNVVPRPSRLLAIFGLWCSKLVCSTVPSGCVVPRTCEMMLSRSYPSWELDPSKRPRSGGSMDITFTNFTSEPSREI